MSDPASIEQQVKRAHQLFKEQREEIKKLQDELAEKNKKIITLEAIIIALGMKDNISKKLEAEAAFEGES